jgi:hypothetical protein
MAEQTRKGEFGSPSGQKWTHEVTYSFTAVRSTRSEPLWHSACSQKCLCDPPFAKQLRICATRQFISHHRCCRQPRRNCRHHLGDRTRHYRESSTCSECITTRPNIHDATTLLPALRPGFPVLSRCHRMVLEIQDSHIFQ